MKYRMRAYVHSQPEMVFLWIIACNRNKLKKIN